MVVEYARNVLGLLDANTAEVNTDGVNQIIDIMPDQKKKLEKKDYGGTMRLGLYPAIIKSGTIARNAYKTDKIEERHRHRYEVNPSYIKTLSDGGMVFSATSPDGVLMEIAELPVEVHPFMVGVQFHPEFNSRPGDPHPIFREFVRAAVLRKNK